MGKLFFCFRGISEFFLVVVITRNTHIFVYRHPLLSLGPARALYGVLGCATLASCLFCVWKYQISHPETPRCMQKKLMNP